MVLTEIKQNLFDYSGAQKSKRALQLGASTGLQLALQLAQVFRMRAGTRETCAW